MALPKKYREKYKAKPNGGEQATFFMFKVVGLTVLFFAIGIGADIYRFFIR